MLIEPTLRSELLAGRVAIVTGGSRGIGGATATTLAANGAHVVVADVDASKANETVACRKIVRMSIDLRALTKEKWNLMMW